MWILVLVQLSSFLYSITTENAIPEMHGRVPYENSTQIPYVNTNQVPEINEKVPDVHANKSIVIIGAGVSGISCAYHLRKFGFTNVLILEAKDRIGGRLYTEYNCTLFDDGGEEGDYFIEMGCQWIHGQEGNAVYKLALANGLVDEYVPDYFEGYFNFRNECSEQESEAILSLVEFLKERTENASLYDDPTLTLSDLLRTGFNNYVREHSNISELLKGAFTFYNLNQYEEEGSKDLSDVSVSLLSQYQECAGNQNVVLKSGYRKVLDFLLRDIPEESIVLSKDVTKVDWSDFKELKLGNETEMSEEKTCEYVYNNVTLEELRCVCNQTECSLKVKVYSADEDIYLADHVVSTLSLGAMKRNFDSHFVPSLPQEKIAAIKAIGFGTINKIFLEFRERFWEPITVYRILWSSSLNDSMKEELLNAKNASDWVFFINRFMYVRGQPHMLCAWISGEGALTMEEAPDEEVINLSMALLEKVVGRQLPRPERIIRSSWNSDPQTFGSYSYLTIDSNEASNTDLAEPVFSNIFGSQKHPVLQFAGEATHPHFYSTVHGAYETGLREARRLYEIYKAG